MKELEYPFDGNYILTNRKKIRRELMASDANFMVKKIAVLGGSTTYDITQILELFLLNEGIQPQFYESGYNRYYEEILFNNQELKKFRPDIIYIHTGIRNIIQYPQMENDEHTVTEILQLEIERYKKIWEKIEKEYACVVIQNNFELPPYRILGNKDASDIHGRINYINRLNMEFYAYAQTHDHFYINDVNYLSASYGLEKWQDSFCWYMYKYSLSISAIPILTFNIANIIKSIYGKNKKVMVIDLDNTLWGGIIGEDGIHNIRIGEETPEGQAYKEFQTYLKFHQQLGILLCINSKNDYESAIEGLNHPDNILKFDDFAIIKANWEEKDKNILCLAQELGLAPDSFVFIDDNPAERELVKTKISGVAVPDIGEVETYIRMIDRSGFFEQTLFSQEDQKRNEMYNENKKREELCASCISYEDYLESLRMAAEISPFQKMYFPRIVQLTNKSNQFNLTTKRYTIQEIEEVTADKSYITLYGKLKDKFGDNGIVSLLIGHIEDVSVHIELWIMSCRVLKREMELAMMDAFMEEVQRRDLKEIIGYYYPTNKNKIVKGHYEHLGFKQKSVDENGNTCWILEVEDSYQKKNKRIQIER